MNVKLVAVLSFFIVCSCTDGMHMIQGDTSTDSISFKLQLPGDEISRVLYNRTLIARDHLGKLDTLETGYHEFQMRIWYEYARSNQRQIVVIKKKEGEDWKAELHTTTWRETPDSNVLTDRTIVNSRPKIGWKLFIDSIKNLNAATLPDQSEVNGMYQSANVSTINVEIANRHQYKFYSYQTPGYYKNQFKEAKDLAQILQLIEEQLGFKRLQQI